MRVSSLWVHPVKSCRAVGLDRVELDETGFRHDRRWMIVDPDGRFVTQRDRPELATVSVTLWGDHVALTAELMAARIRHLVEQTGFDYDICLLYTSPSPRDRTRSRMPSSA